MPVLRTLRLPLVILGAALLAMIAACAFSTSAPPLVPGEARQQLTTGDLTVLLDGPATPQTNQPLRLRVHLRDAQSRPVAGAAVSINLAMPMLCTSGGALTATEVQPGIYEVEARYEMSGAWNIAVAVDRADGRVSATFPVQVQEDPALVMVNPFAADLSAAEVGSRLFAANCVSCHGDGGRGDGPRAAELQPPPADLTLHLAPGKHSDGEVFRWLTDGKPGTAMPAFRDTLSDDDRWRLVAFLRTLAAPQLASSPLPPLAFVRAGNLYRSDGSAKGAQPVSATADLGGISGPAFSPDGSWLAVVASKPSDVAATGRFTIPTLYLLRPDGSELRSLWEAPDELLAAPAWTADGAALVVTARSFTPLGDGGGTVGAPRLVWVPVADGSRTTLLENAEQAALSRDGAAMAFVQRDADTNLRGLLLADADGRNARLLVDGAAFQLIEAPRFAPDGRTLVFSAAGGPPVDADGRPRAVAPPSLTTRAAALFQPPAALAHGGQWEVWSVNNDGSGLRRLTRLATHDPVAAFSPDGSEIVVASEEGLHLMRSDGSDVRLLDSVMALGGVDWAP